MKQIRIIIECKDEDEKEVEEFAHKMGEYLRGHYQQAEYGILSNITEKVFPAPITESKTPGPGGAGGTTIGEIKKDPNESIDFSWGFKK